MEIAVKETYAHMLKDESLVQNSEKIYIVEFILTRAGTDTPRRLSLGQEVPNFPYR